MSSLLLLSGVLAKNGSFGFAKGRLVCRAKPNVPFVRGLILSACMSSSVRSNRLAPNYFIVVADTATDYFLLHRKMFELNRQWQIPIDTMGRFFNVSKNLIALPDDDEDEIYAGDYFPRRFPSGHLSIEYMGFYRGHSGDKMMALISGIYESEKSADSALFVLQKSYQNAFKISSEVYIGCMH